MVQKKRMGFGGLLVGILVVAMFWVTDALDFGGSSSARQTESLGVASADNRGSCTGLSEAAKGVMLARQAGAAREAVAEVLVPLGEDGEVMLALAYGYPVHDAAVDKEQAIVEFAEGIQSRCSRVVAP